VVVEWVVVVGLALVVVAVEWVVVGLVMVGWVGWVVMVQAGLPRTSRSPQLASTFLS
jgi:hypothetical protein